MYIRFVYMIFLFFLFVGLFVSFLYIIILLFLYYQKVGLSAGGGGVIGYAV